MTNNGSTTPFQYLLALINRSDELNARFAKRKRQTCDVGTRLYVCGLGSIAEDGPSVAHVRSLTL